MITVYSFPTCPYCNEMKTLLTNEGIKFRDVNVDLPENEAEYNEILEASQAEEVPIIRIDKTLLVPNKSFHTIQEGFEIAKKLLE